MSVLQKLTKAFRCSERHVERLLVEKTPAGFYRRGRRGRWRVRGPLTEGRMVRISRSWRLALRQRPTLDPSLEPLRAAFERLEKLGGQVGKRIMQTLGRFEASGANAALDYYRTLHGEMPDEQTEPERFRDFWHLPVAEFARKYLPKTIKAAAYDRRLVQLEAAVRRLNAAGKSRPYRLEVAKEMRQPLRTHFAWFTPSEFQRALGEARRRTRTDEKSNLERLVEALASLGGDSDRAEDIARAMKLPAEQFRREFAALLPEAYRLADEETYRGVTYDVDERGNKVDRDLI
jgi:hypothetical protein